MGNEQAGRLAAPRHYVNGAFSLAGTPFPLVDPVTGRTVAQVPEADAAMVDGAVQAARRPRTVSARSATPCTSPSAWSRSSPRGTCRCCC